MHPTSRRAVCAALVGSAAPGCLGTLGRDDCEPLSDGSAPPDGGNGIEDLVVVNERGAPVTVELAVEGPDLRRCATIALDPDGDAAYEHVFADGATYEIGVRLAEHLLPRGRHEWHPETLDDRGVGVYVRDDRIEFREVQH